MTDEPIHLGTSEVWPDVTYPFDNATVLTGEFIELRKFEDKDAKELHAALDDPQVKAHVPYPAFAEDDWSANLTRGKETGRFAWVARLTQPLNGINEGVIVGTSSYYDVSQQNAHLSIGTTMWTKPVWGSVVNPEAKLLMLGFAFDELNTARVQLKTDGLNLRSQAAMRGIGATQEAVLRNHIRRTDGTLRDSVVFAILATEWPRVKTTIEQRLARRR